jgi:hypothetical protein
MGERRSAVFLAAAFFLAAGTARSGAPLPTYSYAPTYVGRFSQYGYAADLMYVVAKTGRICRDCEDKVRGVRLTARKDGFGFFQYGIPIGDAFDVVAILDVSRLRTPGVFVGLEFDSPFVAVGQFPPNFLFAGVALQPDGSLTAFTSHNGTNVGTPASIPAGTENVELRFRYAANLVSVDYAAIPAGPPWSILQAYPFAYAGSGGLGAGMSSAAKGDALGVAVQISGDIFDDQRQALLADLKVATDLITGANADFEAGNAAAAQQKLAMAKDVIERGTLIENTDPPQYTGGLVDRARTLFAENEPAAKQIEKQLDGTVKKIDQATKQAERGKTEGAKKSAAGALEKGVRAKAIIETGAPKERPDDA